MHKKLDLGTQLTLAITLVLFAIALFEKGFTHGLLLEAAVFLVSVKVVIMSYKASVNIRALNSQLVAMTTSLQRIASRRYGRIQRGLVANLENYSNDRFYTPVCMFCHADSLAVRISCKFRVPGVAPWAVAMPA